MQSADAENLIYPALQKAQGLYPKIEKRATGHYGNYADLPSIMEAVRGPNTQAGLIVIHLSGCDPQNPYTETRVIHVDSGQYVTARLPLDPALTDQSLGKSLTYFRRYCLMGLLGICADEDTDAQEAEDEQRGRRSAAKKAPKGASKQTKQDHENTTLGAWWASVQRIMTEGGVITETKSQRDVMAQMVGAAGYESSKELSGVERNELLLEVRRLYGPNAGSTEPPEDTR